MSGPKVVRVITREERLASGEALLRRLDAALGVWELSAVEAGAAPAELRACKARRNELELKLRADKFDEFARAAAAEVGFLEADVDKRVERAAQIRAQEKARLENGRELAKSLLRQGALSPQDVAGLQSAVDGELELKEMDGVIARAWQSLYQPSAPQASEVQIALAARLGAGESAADFADWQSRSVVASPQVTALLAHVANLELLGAGEKAFHLQQEIRAVCELDDEAVRRMRFDSLLVTVKRLKEEALALSRLRRQATLLSAEAVMVEGGTDIANSLAVAVLAGQDELQAALKLAQVRLDEARALMVADSRRRAVFAGLQQLGYQVNEQLSTATSTGGRLVMHDAAEPNYGVEVTSGVGMERIQLRTVALTANRDSSKDIPAEQRWCGDFGDFQKNLKVQGIEIVVEKALGVGAAPIKVLADVPVEHRERSEVTKPVSRQR